jgi:hypothetical protein
MRKPVVSQRKGKKKPKGRKSDMASHGKSRSPKSLQGMPNSSKVGAGEITARRNLPYDALHKRNHRTSEMIGVQLTKLK